MNESPAPAVRGRPLRPATIALGYAVAAVLWILFSDRLAAALATDAAHLSLIQTYKGWAFVAVTTVLLFLLLRHGRRQQDDLLASLAAQAREYRALFESNPNGLRGASERTTRHIMQIGEE